MFKILAIMVQWWPSCSHASLSQKIFFHAWIEQPLCSVKSVFSDFSYLLFSRQSVNSHAMWDNCDKSLQFSDWPLMAYILGHCQASCALKNRFQEALCTSKLNYGHEILPMRNQYIAMLMKAGVWLLKVELCMVEGQPVLGYYSGTNKLSFKKGSQLLELYPLHQNTCTDCITSSWYIEQSSLNPTFTYSPV